MKIEVGKTYLTRDGRKAFVCHKLNKEEAKEYKGISFFGVITDIPVMIQWNKDGSFYANDDTYDLVAEYQDPRLKK